MTPTQRFSRATAQLGAAIDRAAHDIPTAGDRWLALATLVIIGYFAGPAVIEYGLGAIAGGLLVYIWRSADMPDRWFLKRWIVGAHRAHGGDSRWTVDKCTEPECEEGAELLRRLAGTRQ